jgi:RimJ/RimL family protein N-acetyltransferase
VKLTGYGIELNEITANEIEKIRAWRNHPDIMSVSIDKQIISKTQQIAWFNTLSEKQDRLYLLVSYKGQDIGVVSAINETGEALSTAKMITPGLYLAPECKYKNSVLAFSPSLVFIDYLFKQGKCETLHAQVFSHNESAIRYNKMLGYQLGSVDNQGLLSMILNQADFENSKKELTKILRF